MVVKFDKAGAFRELCFLIFDNFGKNYFSVLNEMSVEILLCCGNGDVSDEYLVEVVLLVIAEGLGKWGLVL